MTAMPGPASFAPSKPTGTLADRSERERGLAPILPIGLVIGAAIFVVCIAAIPQDIGDFPIVMTLNRFAGHSAMLDHFVHALTSLDLLQGVVFVAMLWYLWFNTARLETRATLLTGAVAASCAGVVSRLLQVVLPTHLRPVHTDMLAFVRPIGVEPNVLNHYYSFPSDHGALFFGLALVIYLANPRLGVAAFIWAVVVDVARVYEGYHYPSDIIGSIGIAVMVISLFRNRWFNRLGYLAVAQVETVPAIFYAVGFVVSYQIATLFDDMREIGMGIARVVLHHGGFSG